MGVEEGGRKVMAGTSASAVTGREEGGEDKMTSDHGALKTHFNSIPEREMGRVNNISD